MSYPGSYIPPLFQNGAEVSARRNGGEYSAPFWYSIPGAGYCHRLFIRSIIYAVADKGHSSAFHSALLLFTFHHDLFSTFRFYCLTPCCTWLCISVSRSAYISSYYYRIPSCLFVQRKALSLPREAQEGSDWVLPSVISCRPALC